MNAKETVEVSIDDLNTILVKLEKLHHIRDINTLLDSMLTEARILANADAGSVFLVDGKVLRFSYVQNDSLFRNDFLSNKYIYSNQTIPMDTTSLAGYVAVSGDSLVIDDAYNIDPNAPYRWNASFDDISAYKTRSMLIVPLKTSRNDLVGVIELINCLDEEKNVIPFSKHIRYFISQFAFYAGVAIERALLLREVVHKMLRMTAVRDPEETRMHVERVGAYSVELYQRWAEHHGVDRAEIHTYKDVLSIAAMLHDIGKVAIPDSLLQKQGSLNEDEYELMKSHVIHGSEFFENPHSEWDTLAYEITLNHHEHWDGSGYPGTMSVIDGKIHFGKGKRGLQIPLSARIVALADVYDALISKRVYKDPWEEEKVLYHIKNESGKHFDPELVAIFFEIYDIIKAIRSKWE